MMEKNMKAFVLTEPKGCGCLKFVENRSIPAPAPDEIRVRVRAVGLNPVDYKLASGWGNPRWTEAPVLGLDVAGIVDETGGKVKDFLKGERVFYHGNLAGINGGFAEYACTRACSVSRIDDNLSYEVAAAIPCSGFTAYEAVIDKLKLDKGQTILIQAGAGGVGGYAVQLAKSRGASVIATCSSRNEEYVRALGADCIIDYNEADVGMEVMRITNGRGLDYVVDTIGGETATKSIDYLAFGGQIVCIVDLPDFSRLRFFEKGISIHEVSLGAAHLNGDLKAEVHLAEMGEMYMKYLVNGTIKPPSVMTVPMEDIPKSLKVLESRHVVGKIVAKIE